MYCLVLVSLFTASMASNGQFTVVSQHALQGWNNALVNINRVQCLLACSKKTCCLSVNYSKEDRLCQLNERQQEGSQTGNFKQDTRFQYIEKVLNKGSKSEWDVVFRGNAGVGEPTLLTLWTGTTSLNDCPNAKRVDGSSQLPYKSALVEQWGELNITKVKFAFYTNGEEVMTLIFDGVGSNKENWFASDRLLETPYTDIMTSSFNEFTIGPVAGACPGCRMWYISKHHHGCGGDAGWVSVTGHRVCHWDVKYGEAPQFLYSSTQSVTVWQADDTFGHADVMAISIQTVNI